MLKTDIMISADVIAFFLLSNDPMLGEMSSFYFRIYGCVFEEEDSQKWIYDIFFGSDSY